MGINLSNFQRQKIISLIKKLNIVAKNIDLYVEAMTHNSYNNEHRLGFTYQRLEFLGDVVISKIISCYLYYSKLDENEMTEARKLIVGGKTLKKASDELGLLEHALLGKGVDRQLGTNKISEDLFESLMGAIYIDQGEVKVYEILKNTVIKYYETDSLNDNVDYKSKIQELFQKNSADFRAKNKICYKIDKLLDGQFKATLFFGDVKYGEGIGKTIKDAEKLAARESYSKYISPKK